jgi:hypothetical protein
VRYDPIMGERISIKLYDDIDNTKDATTQVHFEYGGKRYRIDLCDENVALFDAAMQPYVRAARELAKNGKPVTRRKKAEPSAREKRERNAEIRAWAIKKRYEVSDRGIIPAAIIEAYEAAH